MAVLRDGWTVAELARNEVTQDAIMYAMAHGDEPTVTGTDVEASQR